jgi:phosphate/sulfate permease
MDHRGGFMANLVTAALVGPGGAQGLPMSTSHGSFGAIIAMGAQNATGLKSALPSRVEVKRRLFPNFLAALRHKHEALRAWPARNFRAHGVLAFREPLRRKVHFSCLRSISADWNLA